MRPLTYNLETMDAIPGAVEVASIAVSTDHGWWAHFGTWQQDAPALAGFEDSLDAWCFIVATTGINPSARIPDKFNHWTKRHPAPEPEPELQPSLFEEAI